MVVSLCYLFMPFLNQQNQQQNSFFSFLFPREAISKECAETGVWENSRGPFLVVLNRVV